MSSEKEVTAPTLAAESSKHPTARGRLAKILDRILLLIAGTSFVFLPLGLLALFSSPPVYYRHFNRVKARLEAMPDVKIVSSWKHEDITLEDFGFTLRVRECPPIRLDFYDGDDWFRRFKKVDGISFFKYPGIKGQYQLTRISADELGKTGVKVQNLGDVFANLESVLACLKGRADQDDWNTPGKPDYLWIQYDLNNKLGSK